MKVFSLDLASTTGFCLAVGDSFTVGEWVLVGARGQKAARLEGLLLDVIREEAPDLIAFEEPAFMKGFKTLTMLAGLQVTVEKVCEQEGVSYVSVPVGTLKKFATGKGNAKKPDMIEAARPHLTKVPTEHEADAFWVAKYAVANVEEGAVK